MRTALITGLEGEGLTPRERTFLREVRPAGLILFTRNCTLPDQIRRLVADALAAIGSDETLVLIDQEGGRVQRLRPPLSRELPPAAAFLAHHPGDVAAAARDARLLARLTADDLAAFAINTSCAPVLDVPVPGAHDIIGNRAYARDPATVAVLGAAVAEGLMAGAVLPVMKHMPGHGRAGADSHLELPVVEAPQSLLAATDFAPFHSLRHLPAAMTAHVLYPALDAAEPASTSATVTADVMRGAIGFDGLLMSDDLGMQALAGDFTTRARAVIAAGSDIALHCSGRFEEMQAVAAGIPALTGPALARFERALAVTRAPRQAFDRDKAIALCHRLLSLIA